jgi:pimeloyl-ACP methyl ester carboxylesterase
VPDADTRAPIDHISIATPIENVSVAGGWNASGSARLTINATTSDPDDPLPSQAILRGSTITQYDRYGSVVASGEEGSIMGAMSRQEWFAAHPVDVSAGGGNATSGTLTASLGLSGLAGRLRISDTKMATLGTPMSAAVIGGVSVSRMNVHMTSGAPGGSTDAIYLRLADSGSASGTAAQWVLHEMRTTLDNGVQLAGKPRMRTVHRTRLRRVTIQDPVLFASLTNPLGGAQNTPLAPGGSRHVFIVPDEPEGPWSPPPQDPPPPPPTNPPVLPPTAQPPLQLPDPAPVVFQHGFSSQADRWNSMRDTLRGRLKIDDRAYTLPTTSGLELASQILLAAVRDTAQFPRTVLVAHSAGGVISRRVAQLDPARIAGIITIGTPHEGALIAERAEQTSALLAGAFVGSFFVSPCASGLLLRRDSNSCKSLDRLADVGSSMYFGALGGAIFTSGSSDLRPGSAFVNQIRRQPENFRRVGITHQIPSHNALARYLGERTAQNIWNDASGDDAVRQYELAVQSAKIGLIVSLIQLFVNNEFTPYGSGYLMNGECGAVYSRLGNCGGFSDPFSASQFQQSQYQLLVEQFQLSLGLYLTLTTSNYFWNWGTTNNTSGDGFIAATSQRYPNVLGSSELPLNVDTDQGQFCYRFLTCGGTPLMAHGGETRNARAGDAIQAQLIARFDVQRRLAF